MSFKIDKYNDLLKKMSSIPKSLKPAYVKIVNKSVLHVRKESQSITPIRTGNLRASARSHAASANDGATGEVWYKADYAVPVHERTWTNLISGQHKFLEKSVHRSRRVISDIMAKGIKAALRRFSA